MVKLADIPTELWNLAFHEAGHAVVGMVIGDMIRDVWISESEGMARFRGGLGLLNTAWFMSLSGSCSEEWVDNYRDLISRELMFHVAGCVAVDLWEGLWSSKEWPEPGRGTGPGIRISDLVACEVVPSDRHSDLAKAILAASMLDKLGLAGDHILEAEQRADALLCAEWDRVRRLARSLCRRRSHRLNFTEVRKLIGSPETLPPPVLPVSLAHKEVTEP